jgi:predicted Zn-dependent protease
MGVALAAAGQTNAALQEFAAAAKLDPHYPWPHLETAKIFLRQGRDAEAVEELKAALRADANNIEILTFTAQVLASAENATIRNGPQAATLAAKANLLANGRRPDVLDVLGMACAEMGKFAEAQMAAQTALDTAAALKMQNLEPIQHRLELYKNHQPWRESFGPTNVPAKN